MAQSHCTLLQVAVGELRMGGVVPPPSHYTSWRGQGQLLPRQRVLTTLTVAVLVAKLDDFPKHALAVWGTSITTHPSYCVLKSLLKNRVAGLYEINL